MKKNIFSLLFFFVLSTCAFAQLEGIDLNKYKLTEFRYRSLGTNLSLNGYGVKQNFFSELIGSDYTAKTKSFNTNLNLGYALNISNRKYIGAHYISGNYNHSFMNDADQSNSNPENIRENKLNRYQLNIKTFNSFYQNDKLFIGINFESSSSQINSIQKQIPTAGSESLEKDILLDTRNQLSVHIGYGRVENITDARQAIYILDDLNKNGRLTHQPTQEEAFEFADFITKVLNKRVIDSREKRIEEYTLVDSFLVSKGLITKQDGRYFGVLNDNWNYARNQSWLTGSKLYFGVVSQLNDMHRFYKETEVDFPLWEEKYTQEIMNKRIGLEAGYEANWIKGLKWINRLNSNVSIFIDHQDPYRSDYPFSERDGKYKRLTEAPGETIS